LGFVGKIKKISFKPILGFPGHKKGSTHSIKACSFSETKVDDILWSIREIEKRGFTPYKDIALGPCEAMREHSYTIDPIGDIYKCAILSGRKEYAIGNIADNLTEVYFSPQNVSFMTIEMPDKCKECKYIPICGGGCRNGAISQKANINTICCEKEYFENVSTKIVISEACEKQ
jgi:radical SAM protein with 4Fe4S-binding SPASM domain